MARDIEVDDEGEWKFGSGRGMWRMDWMGGCWGVGCWLRGEVVVCVGGVAGPGFEGVVCRLLFIEMLALSLRPWLGVEDASALCLIEAWPPPPARVWRRVIGFWNGIFEGLGIGLSFSSSSAISARGFALTGVGVCQGFCGTSFTFC